MFEMFNSRWVAVLGGAVSFLVQDVLPAQWATQATAITCAVLTYMVMDLRREVLRIRTIETTVALLCQQAGIEYTPPAHGTFPFRTLRKGE